MHNDKERHWTLDTPKEINTTQIMEMKKQNAAVQLPSSLTPLSFNY